MTTTELLDDLLAKAEAAGEWRSAEKWVYRGTPSRGEAEHIAAANPTTIKALVQLVKALETELNDLAAEFRWDQELDQPAGMSRLAEYEKAALAALDLYEQLGPTITGD